MYTSIAPYYDQIFPFNKTAFAFLNKHLGDGIILDIACGTGTYAHHLHTLKREVQGFDLDPSMIQQALNKDQKGVTYSVCDMRNVSSNQLVDGIYIIGNSLVHASSLDEIQKMLVRYYNLLQKGGTLIIQIVNYERVLSKGITVLPLIQQEHLTFYREYYFDQNNTMFFQTILEVDDKRIVHKIPLLPITKTQLSTLLRETNFSNQQWFGSYNESPYDKDTSFHAIVVCQKG
jgi:ubiquinone/menaquinone biosynthesis C-methylase UbiE